MSFLPFLSFPPSPCPAGRRGRRGYAAHMASAAALTIFKLSGPFSRPAAWRRGGAAGPSACARGGAAIRGEYARPSNPALGAHVPASQSRPCRACPPAARLSQCAPCRPRPKAGLAAPARPPGPGRRLPGPALPLKIGRPFPYGGTAPVEALLGRRKSAGHVRHCLLPGAPICPAALGRAAFWPLRPAGGGPPAAAGALQGAAQGAKLF